MIALIAILLPFVLVTMGAVLAFRIARGRTTFRGAVMMLTALLVVQLVAALSFVARPGPDDDNCLAVLFGASAYGAALVLAWAGKPGKRKDVRPVVAGGQERTR